MYAYVTFYQYSGPLCQFFDKNNRESRELVREKVELHRNRTSINSMVHHPPHWSTWKCYNKWHTINQLHTKKVVQQNSQFPTKSATNSPEGTGTISKATDTIIPWISILKASLLAEDDNWNTLISTIVIRASIRYVLFTHNYKILKQMAFLMDDRVVYHSILNISQSFSSMHLSIHLTKKREQTIWKYSALSAKEVTPLHNNLEKKKIILLPY